MFVIDSRIALVRFPRIPRSLRSQEYPSVFVDGAVHALRRLQNMSKKKQKAFFVGKNVWPGWLTGHDYVLYIQHKGEQPSHGCPNLHLQPLEQRPGIQWKMPIYLAGVEYCRPVEKTKREAVKGSGS